MSTQNQALTSPQFQGFITILNVWKKIVIYIKQPGLTGIREMTTDA